MTEYQESWAEQQKLHSDLAVSIHKDRPPSADAHLIDNAIHDYAKAAIVLAKLIQHPLTTGEISHVFKIDEKTAAHVIIFERDAYGTLK